jgi:hypothetical protein
VNVHINQAWYKRFACSVYTNRVCRYFYLASWTNYFNPFAQDHYSLSNRRFSGFHVHYIDIGKGEAAQFGDPFCAARAAIASISTKNSGLARLGT